MKKKRIIIASILGATALLAGAGIATIINLNNQNKIQENVYESFDESTIAEDDIFGKGIPSLLVNTEVKKRNTSVDISTPEVYYQYAEVDGKVSIRFFAVVNTLDVDAYWVRTLYDTNGNEVMKTARKQSTKAYKTLSYNGGTVTAPDNYYYVIYTLKNIPAGYGNLDIYLELSNDNDKITTKTASSGTEIVNDALPITTYALDLDMDNTYQGSNTTANNQQYINGKVKTIYSTADTVADASFLEPLYYKSGTLQNKSYTTTTLSFKDDTENANDNYLVYEDQAINPTLTVGMFTLIDNGQGVIGNNNDWLAFNTGAKVTFTTTNTAKLSMTFYQDNNNVKVYSVDGSERTEISMGIDGAYTLPKGEIEIEAASSGYLGKIILKQGDFVTVSGFNAGVAGKQTLTAKYKNATDTYDIYVLATDSAYKDANNNYVVTVDQSYTGAIGAVDGDNGNMFTTISQALEFLQNTSFVQKGANKILNISAGYYKEKLEITTPNLTINGSGTIAKGTYVSDENYKATEYNAATIIEYDTLYGVTDTNGFTHTTDSTQTVAIRESATNCKINGVTISNAYNCTEYFAAKGVSNEHRALALLVQADQFQMSNSALLGYQDTLELMTGRQYFNACYISGTTDYIFGTNNITLFDSCDIHTIYNGSTDGGYITAFKGTNNSKAPTYGVTFYKCNFTKDSDVYTGNDLVEYGNTSLARPWDSSSNVAFIECTMAAHISKAGYIKDNTKNLRYVAWTNKGAVTSEPGVGNVKYVEYGNIGDGAVTSAVDGMTMLTQEQAANYYNFSVIFGTTNGSLSFDEAWNPEVPVVDNKVYYTFDGSDIGGTNGAKFTSTIQNTTGTIGEGDYQLTVDATTGKLAYRSANGDSQFNATTTITSAVKMAAGTSVTVDCYSTNYTINGIVATNKVFTVYFAVEDYLVVASTGGEYIHKININPDGDQASASAIYGESSNVEVSDTFEENTTIDFTTSSGITSALSNEKITFADGFTYNNNGDSIQLNTSTSYFSFKVKAGATVTITSHSTTYGYLLINGVSNNSAVTTVVNATSDMTITIGYDGEHASNCYIKKVEISYPTVISKNTTISFGTDGNYSTIDGVNIGASVQDNGGNNSQVKDGNITFTVAAGAKVEIYGNYIVDFQVSGNAAVSGYTASSGDKTDHPYLGQSKFAYTFENETDVTISCNSGNNYFYWINITF